MRDNRAIKHIDNNKMTLLKWIKYSNQNTYIGRVGKKKKKKGSNYILKDTHFRSKDKCMLKVKRWKRYPMPTVIKIEQKTILISDKIDFR